MTTIAAIVRLTLLDSPQVETDEGVVTPIRGKRIQLLIARLVLLGAPPDDEALAADLLVNGQPMSVSYLRVLRNRARRSDPHVASLFDGVSRWTLKPIDVDVREAVALAERLLHPDSHAAIPSAENLQRALGLTGAPLLADIQTDCPAWLTAERTRLADLHEALLQLSARGLAGTANPVRSGASAPSLRSAAERQELPEAPWLEPLSLPLGVLNNIWQVAGDDGAPPRPFEREHALVAVSRSLNVGRNARSTLPLVLTGADGQGKSTVAHVFASQQPGYRIKWWVSATSDVSIRDGLRALARALGIASADRDARLEARDTPVFLLELRRFFDEAPEDRFLVVLDGLNDPGLQARLDVEVLRLLPSPQVHILITSSLPTWDPSRVHRVGLGPLSQADACALISRSGGRGGDEALVDGLGGRPLLLNQAAAIHRAQPSRRAGEDERTWDDTPDAPAVVDIDAPWADRAILLAVQAAATREPEAGRCISALAYLGAEPLPAELVKLDSAVVDALEQQRLLTRVERMQPPGATAEHAYVVHELVQRVIRAHDDRPLQSVRRAVDLLKHNLPERTRIAERSGIRAMERLAPHIAMLCQHALDMRATGTGATAEVNAVRAAAAILSSMLGILRRRQGEWPAAEEAHHRAVVLAAGAEGALGAVLSVRLANVLRQRRDYGRAEELLAGAIPRLSGPDDRLDRAWALTVKSRTLRCRPDGAPFDALSPLLEAEAILAGEIPDMYDAPATSSSRHDVRRRLSAVCGQLSALHRQLGSYQDAEFWANRGFAALGIAPPDAEPGDERASTPSADWQSELLWVHLRALGNLRRLHGELAEAILLQRRALRIAKRQYGEDHLAVIRCLDSLGRAERDYGDFRQAAERFRLAEAISDYHFGPGSEHAGTAAVNLALTYTNLRDADKALYWAEKGLATYKRVYRDTVADDGTGTLLSEQTAWALYVRGDVHRLREASWGDLGAIERDHLLVHRLRVTKYGDAHPHVASSLYSLGQVSSMQDRYDDELRYHEAALKIRLAALPATSIWVAQSKVRVGQLRQERSLLEEALEIYERALKPNHWRTEGLRDVMAKEIIAAAT